MTEGGCESGKQKAGVSQATVSMILNRRNDVSFSAETVERVECAARELGYELPHRKNKNSTVKFNINDDVNHPKFGKGTIEHIEQLEGSVRLHVRFGEDLKKIDQKWLLQANLKKAGASRHI